MLALCSDRFPTRKESTSSSPRRALAFRLLLLGVAARSAIMLGLSLPEREVEGIDGATGIVHERRTQTLSERHLDTLQFVPPATLQASVTPEVADASTPDAEDAADASKAANAARQEAYDHLQAAHREAAQATAPLRSSLGDGRDSAAVHARTSMREVERTLLMAEEAVREPPRPPGRVATPVKVLHCSER